MAPNDELRAAAERLIQCYPPDAVHQGIYANMDEMAEDASTLAAFFLLDAMKSELGSPQPQPATDEQLAELKRLCDAATRPPWFAVDAGSYWNILDDDHYAAPSLTDEESCAAAEANVRFAVAARTAVPALIARLERAEAETEQVRTQLAGCLVAAEGGISEGVIARQGDYGWSLAYQRTLDLRRERDAMTVENERLQKDAERVEWLENHPEEIKPYTSNGDGSFPHWHYVRADGFLSRGHKNTLRDTIDAAIAAQQESGNG